VAWRGFRVSLRTAEAWCVARPNSEQEVQRERNGYSLPASGASRSARGRTTYIYIYTTGNGVTAEASCWYGHVARYMLRTEVAKLRR
jgi:hypothetical protein